MKHKIILGFLVFVVAGQLIPVFLGLPSFLVTAYKSVTHQPFYFEKSVKMNSSDGKYCASIDKTGLAEITEVRSGKVRWERYLDTVECDRAEIVWKDSTTVEIIGHLRNGLLMNSKVWNWDVETGRLN